MNSFRLQTSRKKECTCNRVLYVYMYIHTCIGIVDFYFVSREIKKLLFLFSMHHGFRGSFLYFFWNGFSEDYVYFQPFSFSVFRIRGLVELILRKSLMPTCVRFFQRFMIYEKFWTQVTKKGNVTSQPLKKE